MVSEIVEISDMTLREIRLAMASSGEGTNAPTAADGDKLEELLAAPGCCSGWQGQAKKIKKIKPIFRKRRFKKKSIPFIFKTVLCTDFS